MDDHVNPRVNPFLSPLTPGFATGRFVGVWWGFVSPILPQLVGNCNFQECKSPAPSPTSARTCSGELH